MQLFRRKSGIGTLLYRIGGNGILFLIILLYGNLSVNGLPQDDNALEPQINIIVHPPEFVIIPRNVTSIILPCVANITGPFIYDETTNNDADDDEMKRPVKEIVVKHTKKKYDAEKMKKTHFIDLIPDEDDGGRIQKKNRQNNKDKDDGDDLIDNQYGEDDDDDEDVDDEVDDDDDDEVENDNGDDKNNQKLKKTALFKREIGHIEEQIEPKIKYSWLRDGKPIKNNLNGLLVLPNGSLKLTRNSSGVYRCIANGTHLGIGAILSLPSKVQKAVFIRQPSLKNLTAQLGTSIVLNSPFFSIPSANITWYINKEKIDFKNNNRYFQLKNGSLLIVNVKDDDNQKFNCVAQNMYSTKPERNHSSFLHVIRNRPTDDEIVKKTKLLPLLQNRTIQLRDGDTLRLYCAGIYDGLVKWHFTSYNSIGNTEMRKSIDGRTYELVIGNVTQELHGGIYRCSTTNDDNYQEFNVTIISPPVFVNTFNSSSNTLGQFVRLKCSASGYPQPIIKWYKNGKPLQLEYIMTYDSPSLIIQSFEPNHKGIYQCIASNAAGEIQITKFLNIPMKQYITAPYDIECLPVNETSLLIKYNSAVLYDGVVYFTAMKYGNPLWQSTHLRTKLSTQEDYFYITNIQRQPYKSFALFLRGLEASGYTSNGKAVNFQYEMSVLSKGVTCGLQGREMYPIFLHNGIFIWWRTNNYSNDDNHNNIIIQFWHNTTNPTVFSNQIIGTIVNLEENHLWSNIDKNLIKLPVNAKFFNYNLYERNNYHYDDPWRPANGNLSGKEMMAGDGGKNGSTIKQSRQSKNGGEKIIQKKRNKKRSIQLRSHNMFRTGIDYVNFNSDSGNFDDDNDNNDGGIENGNNFNIIYDKSKSTTKATTMPTTTSTNTRALNGTIQYGSVTELRLDGKVTGVLIPNTSKIVVRLLIPIKDEYGQEFVPDSKFVEWHTFENYNSKEFKIVEVDSRSAVIQTFNKSIKCISVCLKSSCNDIESQGAYFLLKHLTAFTSYTIRIESCTFPRKRYGDFSFETKRHEVPGAITNHRIRINGDKIIVDWEPPIFLNDAKYYMVNYTIDDSNYSQTIDLNKLSFTFPMEKHEYKYDITIRAAGDGGLLGIPIFINIKNLEKPPFDVGDDGNDNSGDVKTNYKYNDAGDNNNIIGDDYSKMTNYDSKNEYAYKDPKLGIILGIICITLFVSSSLCCIFCQRKCIKWIPHLNNASHMANATATSTTPLPIQPTTRAAIDFHEMQTLIDPAIISAHQVLPPISMTPVTDGHCVVIVPNGNIIKNNNYQNDNNNINNNNNNNNISTNFGGNSKNHNNNINNNINNTIHNNNNNKNKHQGSDEPPYLPIHNNNNNFINSTDNLGNISITTTLDENAIPNVKIMYSSTPRKSNENINNNSLEIDDDDDDEGHNDGKENDCAIKMPLLYDDKIIVPQNVNGLKYLNNNDKNNIHRPPMLNGNCGGSGISSSSTGKLLKNGNIPTHQLLSQLEPPLIENNKSTSIEMIGNHLRITENPQFKEMQIKNTSLIHHKNPNDEDIDNDDDDDDDDEDVGGDDSQQRLLDSTIKDQSCNSICIHRSCNNNNNNNDNDSTNNKSNKIHQNNNNSISSINKDSLSTLSTSSGSPPPPPPSSSTLVLQNGNHGPSSSSTSNPTTIPEASHNNSNNNNNNINNVNNNNNNHQPHNNHHNIHHLNNNKDDSNNFNGNHWKYRIPIVGPNG